MIWILLKLWPALNDSLKLDYNAWYSQRNEAKQVRSMTSPLHPAFLPPEDNFRRLYPVPVVATDATEYEATQRKPKRISEWMWGYTHRTLKDVVIQEN
jgi:hypothetical protein